MSNDQDVECIECAHQCKRHETDAGHCPECGGETMELDDIYGPNGLYPDPEYTPTRGDTAP